MFEEFMLLIGLLFSLYGLSCAISSLVLWFASNKEDGSTTLVIPVHQQEFAKAKIGALTERLKNGGVSYVSVVVLDCDLTPEKHRSVNEYCCKRGIGFCKKEELAEYLAKSSFQKTENTV